MKNMKVSKIILSVIMILLVLSIAVDVRADDTDGNFLLLTSNNTTNNTVNNTTNNTMNNTVNNTAAPVVNTSNKINTNSYSNNTNNLPKTGAEDYTAVFIILGVCIASAVYAYKKANDYNGIK